MLKSFYIDLYIFLYNVSSKEKTISSLFSSKSCVFFIFYKSNNYGNFYFNLLTYNEYYFKD